MTFAHHLFAGKTALVTGATQGIGAGVASALARLGAKVIAVGLGAGDGSLDERVQVIEADVTKAEHVNAVYAQIEQLEASMNTAAEAAVPQAQALLLEAVQKMTISDAKGILAGAPDAATQYLSRSSREQIRARFLPIVKQATDRVGLAQQYNAFAGKAATFGALDAKNASIENYVTEQALDGLFRVIAEQEASIRENPAGAATSLAKKVFGVL